MFLEHFGLREQPFGVTPDPRYLFSSPAHREALASLIYSIESNLGFSALIAEPGMGKTTLLFQILERYRQCARTAFIFNTQCNSYDLLQALLSELDDREVPRESFQLHERFKQILTTAAEDRRMVILVIDEAHNLDKTVMETIRLLSNFESSSFKLLHIILAGQPELAAKLTQHDLCQLEQRIPILTCLPRLSSDETASYIEHRLRVAGYQGRPIFTPDSLARIAGLSRGVPREINRLCFNCLSLAYASAKPVVDVEVFEEVAADLDLASRLERPDKLQPGPHDKASESPPAIVQAAVAPSGSPESVKRPPVREPERRKLNPTPVAASAVTTRPQTPVVTATRPPGRLPASVPQRPALAASQRPRSSNSGLPALAYRWPSRWRPIAFALFYLTVILAGWASATRWLYPIASAARHPSEERTISEQPPFSDDHPSSGNGRAAVAEHETRSARDAEGPSRPTPSPTNFDPTPSRWPGGEPSIRTDAQPGLIKFVRPQYPQSARNRHIQGTVVLNAVVARNGRVKGVRQVKGDPTLLQAAETAVRGWIYRPYRVNGKPVDIDREIVISFSLPKDQP
jgi:TonB family protein